MLTCRGALGLRQLNGWKYLFRGKSMRYMTRRTMAGRKKSAARATFGGTRGWIAAGTLGAHAGLGGTEPGVGAEGQTDPPGGGGGVARADLPRGGSAPAPRERSGPAPPRRARP